MHAGITRGWRAILVQGRDLALTSGKKLKGSPKLSTARCRPYGGPASLFIDWIGVVGGVGRGVQYLGFPGCHAFSGRPIKPYK